MAASSSPEPRRVQPGLYFLSFTEAWERFSFYGMQALLVLYMVDNLLRGDPDHRVLGFSRFRQGLEALTGPLSPQALASQIFGLYAGLVYLTPVFGGMVGDRLWGRRRTVILGAGLMAAGHLLVATERFFLVALALLIVGCGCLKGNISTQVGLLYPSDDDEGRRRGYLLFNVGINIGAFVGPLICGGLGETLGWHWGFGAAGVGMLLGMVIYIIGGRHLPPEPSRVRIRRLSLNHDERRAVIALLGVLVIATLYNIPYGQSMNVGPLWLRDMTNRHLSGFELPVSWYLASDGFFTVAFTPLAIAVLAYLGRRNLAPSALISIAFGCACMGAADLLLAGLSASAPFSRSFVWGFLYFAICDWGYLFVWPVVLALMAQVAPPALKSTLMGVAFLSLFVANLTAGWLGRFYGALPHTQFWLLHGAVALTGVIIGVGAKTTLQKALAVRPDQSRELI